MNARWLTHACVAVVLAATTATTTARRSDAPPLAPDDQEQVRSLTLRPAAPPVPALKHTLVPRMPEQVSGAAAAFYLGGISMLPEKLTDDGKDEDFADALDRYLEMPADQLLKTSAQNFVHLNAMKLLAAGALREHAGWGSNLREEGYHAELPHLNRLRLAARFLAVRARVQLAAGQPDEALRTLRVLFAMARHVREGGTLVDALVGTAIGDTGLDRVEELMQSRDVPNLYWALADLPRPMYSVADAMDWERAALRLSIPTLRDRRPEQLAPGEWQTAITEMSSINIAGNPTALAAAALLFYPQAKQILVDRGHTKQQVEAMPVPQAIGLATFTTYDYWMDELGKWARLPYWRGAAGFRQVEQDLRAAREANGRVNFAFHYLPTLSRAYTTLVRLDRRIAALQTVEAIRAYAAANAGRLPASLDQLNDTPAPLDPTTGRPFEYRVTGDDTAELSSPPPPGEKPGASLRYRITFAK